MASDTWVLKETLMVHASEDQPYLGTARASLGGREVSVNAAPVPLDLRVFLDGEPVFELGMSAPAAPWFRLCADLGYDPETHWDLDAALILFRQVLPAMARGWKDVALPHGEDGLPEGVISLAAVQSAWAEGVRALEERAAGRPAETLVAACFKGLPLRALTFHDDPRTREDFVGNRLDAPYLGIFARLGTDPERRVTLSKATLHATGGMKWSPWKIGGDWREGERDFLSTRGPEALLRTAGLEAAVPGGFREAFLAGLEVLVGHLDPAAEAYRAAFPVGVPWHRDPRTKYLNRMVVEVRPGEHPVLVLDDGTEVQVWEPGNPK